MKKQPFINTLLAFLRKLKIKSTVIGGTSVHIDSSPLKSICVTPERTRVTVSNLQQRIAKVRISIDFVCNYSIEVFLYKLYKFHFIDEKQYNYYVRIWQNS